MKNRFLSIYRYFSLITLLLTLHVSVEADVSSRQPTRLSGHVPTKGIANAVHVEHLHAAHPVPTTFVLPLRNQDELEELVNRIYDPNDQEHFGQFISSEEFIERFSPTQEDYDQVIAYAKEVGLTISQTHANRTLLNVSGSAESIEKAFNLSLNLYQKPNGKKFYAPSNNPEVPGAIASVISSIVGLDNHASWRPLHHQQRNAEKVSSTEPQAFPSGPSGGYAPKDLLAAYNLLQVPENGAGQIIALFELAGYQASDINTYTNYFGLPIAKLHNILVDGGSNAGIDAEVTLDIELALALAPQSQIYVYEGPNSNQGVLDTYNRIATDNIAKQISTSWGIGEDLESVNYIKAENAIFLQMAAHGQTIYAAAGDSGAYDDSNKNTPVVDDPASQPYVVGVGGTKLSVNSQNGNYETESVWNNGYREGAGGGGVSAVWPIPSWQTNISTTYSKTHRNVPDVSLNADPKTGYAIYYDGQWTLYGGTSCAAPLWAAFTARVNQKRTTAKKPALGFANPLLYSIGVGSTYEQDFHDITVGNNLAYSAHPGYDNASGWGSFNGTNLFATLTNSYSSSVLQPNLNISMIHNAPFVKGKTGIYKILVSNDGNGSTLGPVSVNLTLPTGLTYKSFSGVGWSFDQTTLTFCRYDELPAGSSYGTLILKVNVNDNVSSPMSPTATVSGGGSASQTITNLTTVR